MQALLRQAQVAGSFGAVVRTGDDDAGTLLLLMRGRDGTLSALAEGRDRDGAPGFRPTGGGPLDPAEARDLVDREVRRDPDLWVVEFDTDGSAPPMPLRLLP